MAKANVGGHFYPGCEDPKDFFTSDCKHGCGCWMGSSRSGGPDGVDPFGKCPENPEPDNKSEPTPLQKAVMEAPPAKKKEPPHPKTIYLNEGKEDEGQIELKVTEKKVIELYCEDSKEATTLSFDIEDAQEIYLWLKKAVEVLQ